MAVGRSKGRKADGMKGWKEGGKPIFKNERDQVKIKWVGGYCVSRARKVNCDLTGPVLSSAKEWFRKSNS